MNKYNENSLNEHRTRIERTVTALGENFSLRRINLNAEITEHRLRLQEMVVHDN